MKLGKRLLAVSLVGILVLSDMMPVYAGEAKSEMSQEITQNKNVEAQKEEPEIQNEVKDTEEESETQDEVTATEQEKDNNLNVVEESVGTEVADEIEVRAGGINPYPEWQKINGITTRRCTWYAWKQAYERTGVELPGLGNGGEWYDNAANAGYKVGSIAMPNSIAVWQDQGFGHVGYVDWVNESQMHILEGGRTDLPATGGIGDITLPSAVGTYRNNGTQKLIGFIYLDAIAPMIEPNIRVSDISEKGFKFSVNATDNVGVTQIYAHIYMYGQDESQAKRIDGDIQSVDGTNKNVTTTIEVSTDVFNGFAGAYYIVCYAMDAVGNFARVETIPDKSLTLYEVLMEDCGKYDVIKDNAPIRDAPYASINGKDTRFDSVPEGAWLEIVGKYANDYDHTWYMLRGGKWIYGENVKKNLLIWIC